MTLGIVSVVLRKTTLVGLAHHTKTAPALALHEHSLALFLRGLLILRRLLCLSTGAHPLADLFCCSRVSTL